MPPPGSGQKPPPSAARHDRGSPHPDRKRSVRPPVSSSRRFQTGPATTLERSPSAFPACPRHAERPENRCGHSDIHADSP